MLCAVCCADCGAITVSERWRERVSVSSVPARWAQRCSRASSSQARRTPSALLFPLPLLCPFEASLPSQPRFLFSYSPIRHSISFSLFWDWDYSSISYYPVFNCIKPAVGNRVRVRSHEGGYQRVSVATIEN